MQWLHRWFATGAGQELADQETRLISRRLAGLYAQRVLQVGDYGGGRCPTVVGGARLWILDTHYSGQNNLRGSPEVLPLASGSVDVVVLIHQLEFAERPHQIIREAARVLAPEGHLLVVGFNPMSLWGLRRLLTTGRREPPWTGRYLSALRVGDWMQLLGLIPRPHDGIAVMPPLPRRLRRRRSTRPLTYGRSLGPGVRWIGGVHLVMGQKRVAGPSPPRLRWHRRLELIPGGLPQATASARNAGRERLNESG